MADKHYVGEIGTIVLVDCGCDITGATETKFKVRKPYATEEIEWVAVIEGSNYLKYILQDGDFSISGIYKLQTSLVLAGWSGKGETATFQVYDSFE